MSEFEPPSTELTALLFGTLKDAAGTDRVSIKVSTDGDITVESLLALCSAQYPSLAPWLPYSRVAVNQAYADSTQMVQAGDEIALLPPVSGG